MLCKKSLKSARSLLLRKQTVLSPCKTSPDTVGGQFNHEISADKQHRMKNVKGGRTGRFERPS